MDIADVKERRSHLEKLIGSEILEFERATGVRVSSVDLTRFCSIDPNYDGPGYVAIRLEL